jgi:RimJ/RimL family protein N-acetyltransferase
MKHPMLFEGPTLRLAALDLEKDPAVMSAWTYDLDIARTFNSQLPHPLAALEVRRYLEKRQKDGLDNGAIFIFAIHTRLEDRLIGLLNIGHVMWSHGSTGFKLILGESEDRLQFAAEGLHLALQYIFDELNLFRATLVLPEYDQVSISTAESAGFVQEVRLRQADYCRGQLWNRLIFGLLRPDWEARRPVEAEVAA